MEKKDAEPVAVAHVVATMPVAQAVPVQVQPMPVAVAQPMPGQPASDFTVGVGYTPAVPKGQWKSELCSWLAAAPDMCCLVVCCPMVAGPQLYEKVLGRKGACMKWFSVMLVLYLIRQAGETMVRNMRPCRESSSAGCDLDPTYFVWVAAGIFGGCGLALVGALVLSAVRKRIRVKDEIGTGGCGDAEDFCCGFWCPCCITIQMWAQIGREGYQFCNPEGVPTEGGPAV